MSIAVIIVVLLAALLHACWNFFVKSTGDKHISMSAVVLGHTPFALAAILFSPLPGIESLPYILAGAFLHLGYQLFLLASYRIGDLSHVYPLARGSSPIIVAGISVTLLGVHLSWVELTAVVTIGIGIMSLTLVRRSDGLRNSHAALLAIITGGFIASYSLVDGIRHCAWFLWLSVNSKCRNFCGNHESSSPRHYHSNGLRGMVACAPRRWRLVFRVRIGDMGFYRGSDTFGECFA